MNVNIILLVTVLALSIATLFGVRNLKDANESAYSEGVIHGRNECTVLACYE